MAVASQELLLSVTRALIFCVCLFLPGCLRRALLFTVRLWLHNAQTPFPYSPAEGASYDSPRPPSICHRFRRRVQHLGVELPPSWTPWLAVRRRLLPWPAEVSQGVPYEAPGDCGVHSQWAVCAQHPALPVDVQLSPRNMEPPVVCGDCPDGAVVVHVGNHTDDRLHGVYGSGEAPACGRFGCP